MAVLALAYGIALAGSGVHTLINADGERGQVFAGASDLFFAALALLIAVGAYRVSRWAWVLFMSWAVWGLTLNLLRVFFFDDPQYLPLALATLAVFLLTPLDIQVAFRVRHPPNVRLHTRSRNPIDSH